MLVPYERRSDKPGGYDNFIAVDLVSFTNIKESTDKHELIRYNLNYYDRVSYLGEDVDERSQRFSLEVTAECSSSIVNLENVEIVLPCGSLYSIEENFLVEETVFQSKLFFHPNFACDRNTRWKWLKKRTESIDTTINFNFSWCFHRNYFQYFHWFMDVLPRVVASVEFLPNLPIYVCEKSNLKEFMSTSLKLLGVSTDDLVEFGDHHSILATQVSVPLHRFKESRGMRPSFQDGIHYKGGWDPLYLKYINSVFVRAAKAKYGESSRFKRIYISREDAKHRSVVNENELLQILNHYGFEIVVPGYYSLLEQVFIFSQAEIVVGAHGAGLTNIIFSDLYNDPLVIEFMVAGLGDPGYRMITSALSINYKAIAAYPMHNSGRGLAFDDLKVDLELLSSILEEEII
ncbi:glycosyltransferase family 61 protein [Lacimicrobium sp. SS2-24]|uniref:glycosyltransferase family 61 protein n=1 Tax=Lacimicrobium sp. SS2-24 TaxID=2005569 RepID=UPI000B4B68B0|nr:glycosyltransferase family 61 protein [Lacimicrobium sp. SS2-24]